MKNFILFSLFIYSILFLFSCSSDDGGGDLGNAKSNYFPLAENNNWAYDSQQLKDGVLQSTSIINFKLASPDNIDGKNYFPWVQNESNAATSPKISQKNAVSYLSQTFDLNELGLELDEVVEIKDFPILDEKASANTVFYSKTDSREVGEFLGDGSQPVTINFYFESKMISSLSSLVLFNIIPNPTYNNILHTKTSAFVEAITKVLSDSFVYKTGFPLKPNLSIEILEQDVQIIKKSEVQTINYYFSRDIGPVKNDWETKPSNITIETNYNLNTIVDEKPVVWNVDFKKREAKAKIQLVTGFPEVQITIPFDDLPPTFNDLADSLEETQAQIDALPNTTSIKELESYELF